MQVAIRVDASSQIGTGHFMRCMTLANALSQRGAKIRFVSRHMPAYLRDMLAEKGHEFMPLSGDGNEGPSNDLAHACWLGTSQRADAQASFQRLSDQIWDWLIVDHYSLDSRWESALCQITKNTLVIDDIADRQHACDVLLDQNLCADMSTRYVGKVPPYCQLLLGPRFALLQEEFRRLRGTGNPRTGSVNRILVSFGGVDVENYTSRAIEALSKLRVADLRVDVVIGSQHPCRDLIESSCVQHRFTCHVQTARMAALMASADLAIGAAGSTSWERCCLGLPAICVTPALNQVATAAGLQAHGAIVTSKSGTPVTAAELAGALLSLMHQPERVAFMSRAASKLVDGRGAGRVCDQLTRVARKSVARS